MKGPAWAVCIIIALCVPVLACSGSSDAKQVAGLLHIEEGQHFGWRIDVAIPSEVDFRIQGMNGTRVDVLVLDQDNYTSYSQGEQFSYIEDYSALNTDNKTCNMSVLSGSVYIVVDNSNAPDIQGAAEPNGTADVRYWVGSTFDFSSIPTYSSPWMIYSVLAVVGAVFVLVVLLTRKAIKGRKRTTGS